MTWFSAWSARRPTFFPPAATPFQPPPVPDAGREDCTEGRSSRGPAIVAPLPPSPHPPAAPNQRSLAFATSFIDGICDRWFGSRGTPLPPLVPMDTWPLPYLAPNERHPIRMLKVTDAAMAGVYVGVGTERCWMAAALHPHLHKLYLVDRDPRVVYYNRVNAALIQAAAGHRPAYVHLRLAATQPEWQSAATCLTEPRRALLSSPEAHAWWHQQVRLCPRGEMRLFHIPRRQEAFAGANYLWDDALFANVSRFATTPSGVDIRQLELGKGADVSNLRRTLAWRGETISILDISNAWWPNYLPAPALRQLMEGLSPVLAEDSLLLATSRHRRPEDGGASEFHYFAAHPLAALEGWRAFRHTLRRLHETPTEPGEVNCIHAPEPAAPLAQAAA